MLLECPNCDKLWFELEREKQECSYCGYPNADDFLECDDDTDFVEVYNEVYGTAENCDLPF